MSGTPYQSRSANAGGFTLIELMISIALVLVLILGINQVFQYTLQAVGAGQSLGTSIRDSRAAQTAFTTDLSNVATTDGPFFIIHSAQVYAFRNRADQASSKLGDASKIDINGNGVEGDLSVPGEVIAPTTYNFRNHRVDTLEFFARGQYSAQTGSTTFNYPNVSSTEARIWYGFLKLPDNTYVNPDDGASYSGAKNYKFPGLPTGKTQPTGGLNGISASTNPNNFFATDWVLGRVATLLLPSIPAAVTDCFVHNPVTVNLSPLVADTQHKDANNVVWTVSQSRYDVAQTTMADYTTILSNWITSILNRNNIWCYSGDYLLGPYGSVSDTSYECNPFVNTSTLSTGSPQITPAKMARTTPYFLKGCTQFIVEYAGDFVKQDNLPSSPTYGQVIDLVTTGNGQADGIDYELIPPPTNRFPIPPRAQWAKKIRWYGFPRNTSGGTSIPGNNGARYNTTIGSRTFNAGSTTLGDTAANATFPPARDSCALTDVVPLRDVIACSATACATLKTALNPASLPPGPRPAWIERNKPPATGTNSIVDTSAPALYSTGGMTNGANYLVAWGPDSDAAGIPRPKMIRITITLDDANSQSTDGQTYEYVFTLP